MSARPTESVASSHNSAGIALFSSHHQTHHAPLSASNPQCLQHLFSYQAPLVVMFVRHPDKDGTGIVATPPEINTIVKQIEAHFTPLIEANRLLETSSTKTYIGLEFGKAIEMYPPTAAAVLHIYLVAIDQKDIKAKKIAAIAKDWREEISRNGDENHALVLLYHPYLLDVTDMDSVLAQAAKQSFFPRKFSTSTSSNSKLVSIEEAAISAHEFLEEIRKTKVGKAVFVYHPSDVMAKIADALKLSYANRAVRLKVLRHQIQSLRSTPNWSIQDFWRRGYDVAIHHLRFGCLQEAMASFMQLFTEFYNKSDDYGFLARPHDWDVLIRLGSLKNMFDPTRMPSGASFSPNARRSGGSAGGGIHHSPSSSASTGAAASGGGGTSFSGYPPMLSDSADIVDALVFIVGCEMYCAVLLENKAGAMARFECFMEVAREKIAEELQREVDPVARRAATAIAEFFIYRAYMSALDLCCNVAAHSIGGGGSRSSKHHSKSSDALDASMTADNDRAGGGARSVASTAVASDTPTTCETLLGVEDALRVGEELLAAHDSPLQKELEAFQVTLGQMCIAARDHFITLGAVCGIHVKALAAATKLAARGRDESGVGGLRTTPPPPPDGAAARVASQHARSSSALALVKSLPMIDDVKSPEAFEANYLSLTRIAAAAFRSGKRHRHEVVLLLELSQLYLKANPARAAETVRTQILPQLAPSQWGYLHAYSRKLYIECFEGLTGPGGGPVPTGVPETYETCLECLFQLLQKLSDPSERRYYWRKLLHIERALQKLAAESDDADLLDPFPLTALLRSKPRLCLRSTLPAAAGGASSSGIFSPRVTPPPSGEPLTAAPPPATSAEVPRLLPLGTSGDFTVLTAKIDETVYIRLSASCPVDIEQDHQTASKPGDGGAGTSMLNLLPDRLIQLEAVLESKKAWASAAEPLHVVTLTKFHIAAYNPDDQVLDIAMPLVPCHAGEYRLSSITLKIGAIELFTSWQAQPRPFVLFVPEPAIGIEFLVEALKEKHCFADVADDACTATVVIKKPLATQIDDDSDALETAVASGQTCCLDVNRSASSSQNRGGGGDSLTATSSTDPLARTATDISTVYNKLSQQDEGDGAIVGRILVGKPVAVAPSAAAASAGGGASATRRRNSFAATTPHRGQDGHPANFDDTSRIPQVDGDSSPHQLDNSSFTAGDFNLANASLLADYRRSRRRSFTAGGAGLLDDALRTPPAASTSQHHQQYLADKTVDFVDDSINGKKGECTSVPSAFDKKLLAVPDATSDHAVSLGVTASILPNGVYSFSLRLADESVAAKEALLHATTLRLRIPLMPSFMLPEATHFSFCCKRDRDVVVQDTVAAIKFKHAFSAHYDFKPFQGRVNCIVTLSNILDCTSLVLNALKLDLLDVSPAYIVTRSSTTNRTALGREFAPGERLALFFELTPSPSFHSSSGVQRHHVQLAVCYSKWNPSAASPRRPPQQAPRALTLPEFGDVMQSFDTAEGADRPSPRAIARSPAAPSAPSSRDRFPSGLLSPASAGMVATVVSQGTSRSSTPEGLNSNLNHSSLLLGMSSMAKKMPVAEAVGHTDQDWQEFALSHNIYRAPFGGFETKHHCLFNVMVLLVDRNPDGSRDGEHDGTDGCSLPMDFSGLANNLNNAVSCVFSPSLLVPRRWGVEGRVFPIGEPVVFDVNLEPVGSNWPGDDSDGDNDGDDARRAELRIHSKQDVSSDLDTSPDPHNDTMCSAGSFDGMHHSPTRSPVAPRSDRFFIKLVADPSQWMVLGHSVQLRTLSKAADHRCRFTAVPIAPIAASVKTMTSKSSDSDPNAQHVPLAGLFGLVDTPTVVVMRAVETSSSIAHGVAVPVDVVLCRAQLHVRLQ